MPESLIGRIRSAAELLAELQENHPVAYRESYTPQELLRIARMMNGVGER